MAQSFNNSWGESSNLGAALSTPEKRRSHHFGTWGAGKRRNKSTISSSKFRPPSTGGTGSGALELEKLLRIKSEIQLNISKKVDKIKSKVSHSPSTTKSTRMASGNNLVFVDPKILQTDLPNCSPSTSQRQKHEAYLYGDNWSSDEEDAEEEARLDDVYSQGRSHPASSSGTPSIIYSTSSNTSTSTTNYPIEKSKSAGHALNFWKSIDSALSIGKRNKEPRPTCLPPKTPSKHQQLQHQLQQHQQQQTTSTFNGE